MIYVLIEMNYIYLINKDVFPEEELEEYYYKVSFIKAENEEDIKLSIMNLEPYEGTYDYYFIIRNEKEVVIKCRSKSFYREKNIGSVENIKEYIKKCENGSIKEEILELVNKPKDYQENNKVRVYNQKEKIMNEYVEYLEEEDKKKIYLKELNQDIQFYLYSKDKNSVGIKSKCKSNDWVMRIEWSDKMIKELYKQKEFNLKICEKFEVNRKRRCI
ncbi:Hypothetical protein PP7435_CHR1-1829 [Komagataella phaffii CBS 7435]|uniref:Uncharacterized protein n=1 Tax=Komagataella phaffii (strain ATCC 76273 / CBS 7435 / CECT 11047 / NRRL Y-11430 / Wegner 21-1) TaxID=981350 RepID=A0A1G4KP43_KOMPC|nr:Hypothetical protein BQ9382_C1-1250 [Komagataella phaffii CBS 7435]SCV11775.1 Hypothetical protein PP7435_CHR1-1829 [Komagataella phaffii CBS 7435]